MTDTSTQADKGEREAVVELVETVDALGEETRDLAVNLALYLAKAKAHKSTEKLLQMEPEFIRLVNSTMRVIQELTVILNAARNQEKMIYQLPSGRVGKDRIQSRLESIATQCNEILESLNQARDLLA
ncbi:MAG: hypothetical protein J7J98_05335 [candidate division Zixibacteria bacterium]|nr:hypothetical protein [candidate division Zixibacteria bacterium]